MGQLAVTTSVQTTPYVSVTANNYPRIEFYIASTGYDKISADTQTIPVSVELLILVDEIEAGYEGNRQNEMQFTLLPGAVQYFIEHPNFKYQTDQTSIPYLDEINTSLTNVTTGVQRRGTVQLLTISVIWGVIFNTSFSIKC
jgi:hypothetical protein